MVALCHLLVNIYMDAVMRKVTESSVGGVIIDSERVVDLDFADDVALLANSWVVMVEFLLKMGLGLQRFGISGTVLSEMRKKWFQVKHKYVTDMSVNY